MAPPFHVARQEKAVAHGPGRNGLDCGVLIVALPFDHGDSRYTSEDMRISKNNRKLNITLYTDGVVREETCNLFIPLTRRFNDRKCL